MKRPPSLAEAWRANDHDARLLWMTRGEIAPRYESHEGDLIRWTQTEEGPRIKVIAEAGKRAGKAGQ